MNLRMEFLRIVYYLIIVHYLISDYSVMGFFSINKFVSFKLHEVYCEFYIKNQTRSEIIQAFHFKKGFVIYYQ